MLIRQSSLLLLLLAVHASFAAGGEPDPLAPPFHWKASPPLLGPAQREDPCYSVKDPSVVRYGNQWHVFCTIRSERRSHQIEYVRFDDWSDTSKAERFVLQISNGYFCAPQVFYFRPHRKWYMVLQVADPSRKPALQPAVSTNDDIADPGGWSKPVLLYHKAHPANVTAWIDFWLICDGARAHLFFTSNNGLLWHASAPLAEFPHGWDEPRVVLRGDIFEASCTYALKGKKGYLTIVEAERSGAGRGWRYYKAYRADRLDGDWTPLADTWEKPFAGPQNVTFEGSPWSDSISHGELLRDGYDERLEVDPAHLRFIFQGARDEDRRGKAYGHIPWRLGMLERAPAPPGMTPAGR